MTRHLFVEPEELIILGIILIANSVDTETNITFLDNTTCSGMHCSTPSLISTSSTEADQSCSNYSRGWGLQGSDWGCCGNYEGCCTYASLICYFHDAMCRCCDVGNNFCGPSCKPEVECFSEQVENANASKVNEVNFQVNDDEDFVGSEKNQTHFNEFVNETANAVKSSPFIPGEFLDIEEIEKTINNTENMHNYQFGLEVERLLNETEYLLDQNDEIDDQGSGDASHKPVF